jgi:S-adenosylmethionine decarboxylase
MSEPGTLLHKPVMAAPGKHLLIDFWGAVGLQDADLIEQSMRSAAEACGATVLQVNLHEFGLGCGITGAAILAESHITIHTWPEIEYAALDVFMCGNCDSSKAIEPLKRFFKPVEMRVDEVKRGQR